jgi:Fic family protein
LRPEDIIRRCDVLIGRPGQSLAEARFVPPMHAALSPLLRDFERFLNDPGDLPVVVQLALAHYQFETIHPFMDGNGRVGRLLIVEAKLRRPRVLTAIVATALGRPPSA